MSNSPAATTTSHLKCRAQCSLLVERTKVGMGQGDALLRESSISATLLLLSQLTLCVRTQASYRGRSLFEARKAAIGRSWVKRRT